MESRDTGPGERAAAAPVAAMVYTRPIKQSESDLRSRTLFQPQHSATTSSSSVQPSGVARKKQIAPGCNSPEIWTLLPRVYFDSFHTTATATMKGEEEEEEEGASCYCPSDHLFSAGLDIQPKSHMCWGEYNSNFCAQNSPAACYCWYNNNPCTQIPHLHRIHRGNMEEHWLHNGTRNKVSSSMSSDKDRSAVVLPNVENDGETQE
ncbi:hypothetical protein DAPPUDRAFT_239034 [Daphnia pulex]|uniref:Uncharacterized protein n=1 Tax=Daphnia pulex TaxID=6669 RepID=E9G858_DAPPU|nr:hypothetical protein DAPPUDRAFT_239034 [Daphnia pulex]|eukprot:EFX83919.1 hypothetical protein DAPPUDRAFT_239034 [Daphnia pulex]